MDSEPRKKYARGDTGLGQTEIFAHREGREDVGDGGGAFRAPEHGLGRV